MSKNRLDKQQINYNINDFPSLKHYIELSARIFWKLWTSSAIQGLCFSSMDLRQFKLKAILLFCNEKQLYITMDIVGWLLTIHGYHLIVTGRSCIFMRCFQTSYFNKKEHTFNLLLSLFCVIHQRRGFLISPGSNYLKKEIMA